MEMAYDDQQKPHRNRDPQNPIRNLFTGSTKTSIQCAGCRQTSVTKEPFCCISLDIDKTDVDLGEAFEIFCRDEILRGEDKYFCSKCKRKRVAHKRLTLSEIPPILALHFKRFSVHFAADHHKQGTMKKIGSRVEFPEILDFKKLKNVIHEDDRDTALIDSKYELYAVLVHSGPQLGYGHYYALIRSPDGYWFRMNDMEVIPVNMKHVLREQGYIVFYRRKTNNLMNCQLKRIKAAKSTNTTDSIDEDFNDISGNNTNHTNHGDEEKEDTDNEDMSVDMLPFGVSKLSSLSRKQLELLKDQYEESLERWKGIAENRKNQRRSKVVREARENMEVERARIQEIDDLLEEQQRGMKEIQNGQNGKDKKEKMETHGGAVNDVNSDFVNDDYFVNTCNDPVSTGSMVVVEEVEAQLSMFRRMLPYRRYDPIGDHFNI